MEELQQPISLSILHAVLRNLFQERDGLLANDSQFEDHGSVEHGIGLLLVREYPAVLAPTDAGPAQDGVASGHAAVLVVADDASQQPVVGGRDVVVVVEKDGGQRRGVHTEELVLRHFSRQLGVQGVDTFHDEHFVVLQPQLSSAHTALSRGEVVAGQLHLLAPEQCVQLLVEQR